MAGNAERSRKKAITVFMDEGVEARKNLTTIFTGATIGEWHPGAGLLRAATSRRSFSISETVLISSGAMIHSAEPLEKRDSIFARSSFRR